MIERRKAAMVLVSLGAGPAVAGSFQDTYGKVCRGAGPPDQSITTTLWTVTSNPPTGTESNAYIALPVQEDLEAR